MCKDLQRFEVVDLIWTLVWSLQVHPMNERFKRSWTCKISPSLQESFKNIYNKSSSIIRNHDLLIRMLQVLKEITWKLQIMVIIKLPPNNKILHDQKWRKEVSLYTKAKRYSQIGGKIKIKWKGVTHIRECTISI